MVKRMAIASLVAALAGAAPAAQRNKPAGNAPVQQAAGDMQAAMDSAQANAKHPGDEAMSCEALQDELVATMQDPAVQGIIAKQGAYAQEQQAKLKAAQEAHGSGPSKGEIAAQMAMGFASGFVPGVGAGNMAAQAAQTQAMASQAAANQAAMAERMREMATIMPQMMRGQRLIELAQKRKCDWAGGQ